MQVLLRLARAIPSRSGCIRVPRAAALFAAAALVGRLCPALRVSPPDAERVVTVALVLILFAGGTHIGWHRLRSTAVPVVTAGLLGTFGTTAAIAALAHVGFGFGWYAAALLGTAIAPTDPAIVFSVLGKNPIPGRGRTIVEAESGANDPVSIALLAGLLAAGRLDGGAAADIAGRFALQIGIGALTGAAAGLLMLAVLRRYSPSPGLQAIGALAAIAAIYPATATAHGSGFLAVFVAGIVVGQGLESHRFRARPVHVTLGELGEVAAFVVLGLTVDLHDLASPNVWGPGLALAAAAAVVVRPLVLTVCLLPVALSRAERAFVLFTGLKGAVPLLLGLEILRSSVPDGERLYAIVVVAVALSVFVHAALVPAVARGRGS